MAPRNEAHNDHADDDKTPSPLFGGDGRPVVYADDIKSVKLYRMLPNRFGQLTKRVLSKKEQGRLVINPVETTQEDIGNVYGDGVYFVEPVGHRGLPLKGGYQFIVGEGNDADDDEDGDEEESDEAPQQNGMFPGMMPNPYQQGMVSPMVAGMVSGVPGTAYPYGGMQGFVMPPGQPSAGQGQTDTIRAIDEASKRAETAYREQADAARKSASEGVDIASKMLALVKSVTPGATGAADPAVEEAVKVLRQQNEDLRRELVNQANRHLAEAEESRRSSRDRERAAGDEAERAARKMRDDLDEVRRQMTRAQDDAASQMSRLREEARADLRKRESEWDDERRKLLTRADEDRRSVERDRDEQVRHLRESLDRMTAEWTRKFDTIDRDLMARTKEYEDQIRKAQLRDYEQTQLILSSKGDVSSAKAERERIEKDLKADIARLEKDLTRMRKENEELEEDLESRDEELTELRKKGGLGDPTSPGIVNWIAKNLDSIGPMVMEMMATLRGPAANPGGAAPVSAQAAEHGAPPPRQVAADQSPSAPQPQAASTWQGEPAWQQTQYDPLPQASARIDPPAPPVATPRAAPRLVNGTWVSDATETPPPVRPVPPAVVAPVVPVAVAPDEVDDAEFEDTEDDADDSDTDESEAATA